MLLPHLRALALVHRPSSNNFKEFRSINRSLSLVCRQIYPCTLPHDTSQRRSCGCWRAVCTAGGARWRTTPGVQTCMQAYAYTHTAWFLFLVALYIYMFLSGVCQICRPVYLESTEPSSLCILTSPWCRWEGFSDRFRNDPKMSSYCSWWCVSGAIPAACCFGPRGSG